MTKAVRFTSVLTVFFLCTMSMHAQEGDEPLLDALRKLFGSKHLSIGVLVQAIGDAQIERTAPGKNGFSVGALRLKVYGELDGGFGYMLQEEFSPSTRALDARLHYRYSPAFRVQAGFYKTPFSAEFLIPKDRHDFISLAQVADGLAPNRQVGVMATGMFASDVVTYYAGVFNGNRGLGGNDNNDFMYMGRLLFRVKPGSSQDSRNKLDIGINVAYSKDDDAAVGSGMLPNFKGTRKLAGGDIRFVMGRLLVSGEFNAADLRPAAGGKFRPYGYHATAGFMVLSNMQVLVRWDDFRPDGVRPDSRLAILGINYWPTGATKFVLNYIVSPDDRVFKHHRLLLNAQVAF